MTLGQFNEGQTMEDVTGFTRDMLAKAIEAALAPMVGEPLTDDNVESVKSTVERKLREFYAANDVHFPRRIGVTAGRVRELLGKPTHVPEDATLWLLAQRVGVETDAATHSLRLFMEYDGEWRHGTQRWQAAETETAAGMAFES